MMMIYKIENENLDSPPPGFQYLCFQSLDDLKMLPGLLKVTSVFYSIH